MQNRLARIDKYSGYQTVSESVEYRYNTAGIRIQKTEDPDETPILTDYLIDPYNHTGYAQVLQETVDDGSSDWTRIQYTIGDDVLAQTSLTSADSGANWTTGDTQYLLYDGHGSTRQLVSDTGAVQDGYNYDGYGVMLGDSTTPNPAKTAGTSLLYSGEQYDSNLDQYYLRARYYNQNNGTFNRVDPYSGNMQDPQSLHKYAYVHNNPVNGIDPSGESFALLGFSILSCLKLLLIGLLIVAVVSGPALWGIYRTSNAYLKIKTKGQWFARTTKVKSPQEFIEVFEKIKRDGRKITFFEYYGHGFGDDIEWPAGRGTGLAIGKDSGIVVNNKADSTPKCN